MQHVMEFVCYVCVLFTSVHGVNLQKSGEQCFPSVRYHVPAELNLEGYAEDDSNVCKDVIKLDRMTIQVTEEKANLVKEKLVFDLETFKLDGWDAAGLDGKNPLADQMKALELKGHCDIVGVHCSRKNFLEFQMECTAPVTLTQCSGGCVCSLCEALFPGFMQTEVKDYQLWFLDKALHDGTRAAKEHAIKNHEILYYAREWTWAKYQDSFQAEGLIPKYEMNSKMCVNEKGNVHDGLTENRHKDP